MIRSIRARISHMLGLLGMKAFEQSGWADVGCLEITVKSPARATSSASRSSDELAEKRLGPAESRFEVAAEGISRVERLGLSLAGGSFFSVRTSAPCSERAME